MLSNTVSVPGRPTNLDNSTARAYCGCRSYVFTSLVSSLESSGLSCFSCHSVNFSIPDEIIAGMHSEVLATAHYLQCVSLKFVFRQPLEVLAGIYSYQWHLP